MKGTWWTAGSFAAGQAKGPEAEGGPADHGCTGGGVAFLAAGWPPCAVSQTSVDAQGVDDPGTDTDATASFWQTCGRSTPSIRSVTCHFSQRTKQPWDVERAVNARRICETSHTGPADHALKGAPFQTNSQHPLTHR